VLIDFNEATVMSSLDGPPAVVEQIFNNTGESGKFRTFRNRLLFLLANGQELERAIDIAREYKAIQTSCAALTVWRICRKASRSSSRKRKGRWIWRCALR
jgi:hypothetical protein